MAKTLNELEEDVKLILEKLKDYDYKRESKIAYENLMYEAGQRHCKEGFVWDKAVGACVTKSDHSPRVYAGPDLIVYQNTDVTLAGTATDADNNIKVMAWTQANGKLVTLTHSADGTTAKFKATDLGVYVFNFTAIDQTGLKGVDSINVVCMAQPPTGTFTVSAGNDKNVKVETFPTIVHLYGKITGKVSIKNYGWTGLPSIPKSLAPLVPIPAPGVYELTLTATSVLGETKSDSLKVTAEKIATTPQTPIANFTYSPTTVPINTVVNLDASSSSDPDGTIASYKWAITDQLVIANPTAPKTSFNILNKQSVDITLTVTDNSGLTATKTVTINTGTTPPPTDPVAKLIAPSTVKTGDTVVLDGSQSVADTLDITQTAGTTVTLTNAGTFKKQFVAPNTAQTLSFRAVATKGTLTNTTTASVQVSTTTPPPTTIKYAFSRKWGTNGTGNGQFRQIDGISVGPDGNIYVADWVRHDIQKFTPSGQFIRRYGGTVGQASSANGAFNTPWIIRFDPKDGHMWVSDQFNHRLQKINRDTGAYMRQIGPIISGLTSPSNLNEPEDFDFDPVDHSIYINDQHNSRIVKVDYNGNFITKWQPFSQKYPDEYPEGMVVHPKTRNVYITAYFQTKIDIFNPQGQLVSTISRPEGTAAGQFTLPMERCAIDKDGKFYQLNGNPNPKVFVFDNTGTNSNILAEFGSGPGSANGQLDDAEGIAVDNNYDVYITDQNNYRISVFSLVTTTPVTDPVAKLVAPSQVKGGDTVVLDGSQSVADTLDISQTAGTTTNLVDAGKFKKQFVCPTGNFSLGYKAVATKGTKTSTSQVSIQVSTNQPPPPEGEIDAFGMKILAGKPTGKKKAMEEGSDHENGKRYNVNHEFHNYIMQGYFKLGKGQEKINHKGDGPNHGGCTDKKICAWYELDYVIATGKGELQLENPHPTNIDIPDSACEFVKTLAPAKEGQWIGWATAYFWGPDGKRHIRSYVDLKPFADIMTGEGKPLNNWQELVFAIEKGQIFKGITHPRNMQQVIDHEAGLESEIRMHRAVSGDTKMKNVWVIELQAGGTLPPPTDVDAKFPELLAKAVPGSTFVLDGSGSTGNITNWSITQTAGPTVNLVDNPKKYSKQFVMPNAEVRFTLMVSNGTKSDTDNITVRVEDDIPPPPPTEGKVLWDSNIHLKVDKETKVTSTFGSQAPDGKGIFTAASGSPRVIIRPDGSFYLEADAGHGRVYLKARNYNAMMEGEIMFPDDFNVVRNSTLRLRSRHNMGGANENKFGGFGATVEVQEQLAEYATEPYHNVHENDIKKPLTKKIERGKWIKFRYYVCNSPDNKKVLFKTLYDYNDGKGFVEVLRGEHPSPKPYYMDKSLYDAESYAWLRMNNEGTGRVEYKNVRIIEINSIPE